MAQFGVASAHVLMPRGMPATQQCHVVGKKKVRDTAVIQTGSTIKKQLTLVFSSKKRRKRKSIFY